MFALIFRFWFQDISEVNSRKLLYFEE